MANKQHCRFKVLFPLILTFFYFTSFSQDRKISVFLNGQFTGTISDYTKGNNPWALGLGIQGYYNSPSKFSPTIDITGDLYLADDKVLRTDQEGNPPEDLGGVVNIFGGVAFAPKNKIYMSLVMGPSIMSEQTCFGIKPSIGFYFSENKRWTGKISYINVFNRDKKTGQDFSSISLTLGMKIY